MAWLRSANRPGHGPARPTPPSFSVRCTLFSQAACTVRASTRSGWSASQLTEKLCGPGAFTVRGAETLVWAPDTTCAQWRDFIQHNQWGKDEGKDMRSFVRPVRGPPVSTHKRSNHLYRPCVLTLARVGCHPQAARRSNFQVF